MLGLLQSGGWVLGQAMEQVTGGNLLSMLLIACVFTLSLIYLFRLAVGHVVQVPAGAVGAPQGSSVLGVGVGCCRWWPRSLLAPSLVPRWNWGCAGRRSPRGGSGFDLRASDGALQSLQSRWWVCRLLASAEVAVALSESTVEVLGLFVRALLASFVQLRLRGVSLCSLVGLVSLLNLA